MLLMKFDVKKMKEECNRVKALKGKCLPWYEDRRPPDQVWMEDNIKRVNGVGGAKGHKLIECGVKTVADIKKKSEDELLTLSQTISGV